MLVKGDWFLEWFNSPYYHKLYFNRDENEEAGFIRQLLAKLSPKKESFLLDTACGQGSFSRTLAKEGFDVTGVDISPASISIAQASEAENLHFFQHDLRLPFWINYFDYAFNFFNHFGYFRTEREHYNAIRTVGNSLKYEGILVLDYLNVHYAEDNLTHITEKQIGDVTYYITKWFDEHYFYKKIVIEDEMLPEPLEFTEKVAKFSMGDLNDMLAFNKLQLQEVYGSYSFDNYHIKNSPRLLMIAKKLA